jgi:hypothetical protein
MRGWGTIVVPIQAQTATPPMVTVPVMTPAQIYAQLEAQVLPVLRDYQSDLTVQTATA